MSASTGILLLNMGGPDSLESVRTFLFNLFSDRKIIRLGPRLLQRPIAWWIAKKRAPKSAECYKKIGGKSPLLDITIRQARSLEVLLNQEDAPGGPYTCVAGMRYFSPRTPEQVAQLAERGIKKLVGLSMYPHYSQATSGTSIDDFLESTRHYAMEKVATVDSYPDHPLYIKALSRCLKAGLSRISDRENFRLVYSAHSLPKKMVDEGDPYLEHVNRTISALEKETGLKGTLCFQSRSGPVKWLEPATDELLTDLADRGVKEILCLPISFVSDHVETLYEIDILYREMMKKRGVRLVRTPSLNTDPLFIACLKELVLSCI